MRLRRHSAAIWHSFLWVRPRHQQGLAVAASWWWWQWRCWWPTAGDGCSRCGQGGALSWQSFGSGGTAVPNADGAFVVEDIAGAVSAAECRDVVLAAGTAGSNHRKPAKIR